MKKTGFSIIELIVGISFISVVSVSILATTLHINKLINNKMQIHAIKEDEALIYKDIATLFSTRNIENIKYDNSSKKYSITFTKHTLDPDSSAQVIKNIYELYVDGNNFHFGDKLYEGKKYFKYTNLTIQKIVSKTDSNHYYIVLNLIYKYSGKENVMSIYYVNDPVSTLENIEERTYD